MNPILVQEVEQADTLLEQISATLKEGGRQDAAELARIAWSAAKPALIMGSHLNPVHHTAHVVDTLVRIIIREIECPEPETSASRVTEGDLRLGTVAAIFHDAGNAFEPKDEQKIRKQEVQDNPALRPAAIAQRSRHMQNGGVLVETFMRGAVGFNFTEDDIRVVRRLVEHHDDPTVAAFLDDDEDKRKHLFVGESTDHVLADIYPLSAILREADRLWMLTIPGIVCDLIRNLSAGKPWNPREQTAANVSNHQKEARLYQQLFGDSAGLGFEDDAAFYRSIAGKEYFRHWPEAARKLEDEEWIAAVTAAWFIGP